MQQAVSKSSQLAVRFESVSKAAGCPDKYTASFRSKPAESKFSSQQQLQQHAVSQPADRGVVLRGVALLYEFPGGNQVDGLPPVPTLGQSIGINSYVKHTKMLEIV